MQNTVRKEFIILYLFYYILEVLGYILFVKYCEKRNLLFYLSILSYLGIIYLYIYLIYYFNILFVTVDFFLTNLFFLTKISTTGTFRVKLKEICEASG